jgi:hypothetical protein
MRAGGEARGRSRPATIVRFRVTGAASVTALSSFAHGGSGSLRGDSTDPSAPGIAGGGSTSNGREERVGAAKTPCRDASGRGRAGAGALPQLAPMVPARTRRLFDAYRMTSSRAAARKCDRFGEISANAGATQSGSILAEFARLQGTASMCATRNPAEFQTEYPLHLLRALAPTLGRRPCLEFICIELHGLGPS